ncbi:MAG: hypothetical protein CSA23_07690 [Deltaproteobacteria bacterium]|nr:MAG: hypothetical protein CSA23_07690 [Deltaproteobacteria bacterium]
MAITLSDRSCLSRNKQIGSRSKLSNIFTAGIWLIFSRINKCSYNADIEQIGHFRMGTDMGQTTYNACAPDDQCVKKFLNIKAPQGGGQEKSEMKCG